MCTVFVDSSRKEVFSEENFSSHIKQFAESIVNQIDNAELLQENYENDFSAYVSNFIDAYEVQTAEDIVNAFRDKVIKLASEESIPCAYFDGKLFYIADARGEYEDAMDYARLSWQKYFKLCGEKHPRTIAAMSNLAKALFDSGRKDEAIELTEKMLRLTRFCQ